MAEETFMVLYDIQAAGASNAYFEKTAAVTGFTESKIGNAEWEGNGTTEPGLYTQVGGNVGQCKMVELKAKSRADAVAICRTLLAQNAGGERTVKEPKVNSPVII